MTERSALLVTPEALAHEIGVPLSGGAGQVTSRAIAHGAVNAESALPAKPGGSAERAKGAENTGAAGSSGSGHVPRTLVLDVRWSLGGPDGRPAFAAGHVPGAVYVDLETELSGHGPATEGRHPLPGDAVLTRAARRWGLQEGEHVVAYDGGGNLAAARLWWLLRDAGVDVRLLDGAWPAWVAAGLPVETGSEADQNESSSMITITGGRMPRLSLAEVASQARAGVVLDARAAERYSGETEPVDPRAGHIPGARSLPTAGHLNADGTFLSVADLRARFEAVGVRFGDEAAAPAGENVDAAPDSSAAQAKHAAGQRVGAYCGSGITASHTLFALELAGHRGALYPGSWSQWANQPERPVATGPTP